MDIFIVTLYLALLSHFGRGQNTAVVQIGEIPILVVAQTTPVSATHEGTAPTPNNVVDENTTPGRYTTDVTNYRTQSPPIIQTVKPKYIVCRSDTDCQRHKNERCRKFRGGPTGKCNCIAGHWWARDGNSCVAVKYYEVILLTRNEYRLEYDDKGTPDYRYIEYQAREGMHDALMESNLKSILVSTKSYCGIQNSTSGHVILSFKLKLSRSYAPEEAEVRTDIINGIKSVLQENDRYDHTTLSDTIVLVKQSDLRALQIKAPDPCTSGYMNYCDRNAVCVSSVRSFSCHCKEGYTDVSFDKVETPGERCELFCECSEHGHCITSEEKGVYCQCNGWYVGSKCDIDGKLLLIGISAVLGGLLLIGIVCCACCMCRMRNNITESDDSTSMTTLDRQNTDSTGKTPYSWVNTWRYYNFNPTYPTNNPYATWMRNPGHSRRSKRNRVEPYPGTVVMYPSPLAIPRPQVTPVGYNSSLYY